MTELIYVLLGAILAVLLLAVGLVAGVVMSFIRHKETATQASLKPETVPQTRALTEAEEAERQRLIADQNAFRLLMNYNEDMAYGRVSADDSVRGSET